MGLLEQEMSGARWIDIPEEIQEIWSIWRPSPLVMANYLEEKIEATRDLKEPKTILFNLSGHGLLDLSAYDAFFAGKLQDIDYPEESVEAAKKNLPKI